jgi:hypothetical protein
VKKSKTKKAPKAPKLLPVDVVKSFVTKALTYTDTVYIGIDPGTTGAIAFRCNKAYCVIDIPVILTPKKKQRKTSFKERQRTGKKTKTVNAMDSQFDLPTIVAVFRLLKDLKSRIKVILEKIPPTIGPGRKYAEIMLNRAYAMWPLFLATKGYVVYERRPGVWKERMHLLDKDKEDSRHKALALFPSADILRKKDHNRAEALLLVEALRRELTDANRK